MSAGRGAVAGSRFANPTSVPFVSAAIVAAGFVAIWLSWRGAAALLDVGLQVPYAVSGGAGGLALIVFGLGMVYVHVLRTAAAAESAAIDALNEELVAAAVAIVTRPREPHRHAARRARRAARRTTGGGQSTETGDR